MPREKLTISLQVNFGRNTNFRYEFIYTVWCLLFQVLEWVQVLTVESLDGCLQLESQDRTECVKIYHTINFLCSLECTAIPAAWRNGKEFRLVFTNMATMLGLGRGITPLSGAAAQAALDGHCSANSRFVASEIKWCCTTYLALA